MPSVGVEDLQRFEKRPRSRAEGFPASWLRGADSADAVHVPPSPPTCRSPSDLGALP